MTKKIKPTVGHLIASLMLATWAACVAWADTQGDGATIGSGSNPCAGNYTAFAKMTNSAGAFWITPTAGTSTGTFKDASGFPAPYSSVVQVMRRSDLATWCGTNSVTFPATSSNSYCLTVFVTSKPPPPTSGQTMSLQVTWH
jgi:hypothetical protein